MVVTVSSAGGPTDVERILDLTAASSHSAQVHLARVDIPIGLSDSGPRRCEVEARKMVVARRSSIFPAPLRAVLGTTSYEEALAPSTGVAGRICPARRSPSCPRSPRSISP